MIDQTPTLAMASWKDLTEEQPKEMKTPVELAPFEMLPELLQRWREQGYVKLSGLISDEDLDRYSEARERILPKDRSAKDNYWTGWHYPTPYIDCPELMDLATHPQIMTALRYLIGEEMAVHLALTGWVSTERKWHQDTYLNPDFLWSFYAAVWIALDDIDEDSGPFEMVTGSHNWPSLRRDRLFRYLTPGERTSPDWPTFTQDDVGRVCEEEMQNRGEVPERFIAKKGDILIWHSNLVHRGSPPKNPELLRKALICHYSAINKRFDMDTIKRNPNNGQVYFDFPKRS